MAKCAIAITTLVSALLLIAGCSDDPASPEELSIQDRVNAASVGDTVLIAPGTYTDIHEYELTLGYTIQAFCVVKPGVVVRGETGDPSDVIVDVQGAGYGFVFLNADESTGIADVTIRNAMWAVYGQYNYVALRIDNCVIEDNGDLGGDIWATKGAGMYFEWSYVSVNDCVFKGNKAAVGGAAALWDSSNASFRHCTFTGNSAAGGGGLSVGGNSKVTLRDCSFMGNSAMQGGGGISAVGSSLEMINGSVIGNVSGERGGGVYIFDAGSGVRFTNVALLENESPEGAQGFVAPYVGAVYLECCETDLSGWAGELSVDDSECE